MWNVISAEGKKVNILEIECLRSLVGVPRIYLVRNEKLRGKAGIKNSWRVEWISEIGGSLPVERIYRY